MIVVWVVIGVLVVIGLIALAGYNRFVRQRNLIDNSWSNVDTELKRRFFHLPYFSAAMTIESSEGEVRYDSRRRHSPQADASFTARYHVDGPASEPAPGTLEYFLTERYCLFTNKRSGQVLRVDIHHPPWTLQPAAAEFGNNSMAAAAGITLPPTAPLLHVAGRQDVVAWMPVALD